MKKFLSILTLSTLTACSVFGVQGEEKPDYTVMKTAPNSNIELRQYQPLVVASTTVTGNYEDMKGIAFQRLFEYISGDNNGAQDIAMTAPVMMDEQENTSSKTGTKISMTAPVLMDKEPKDETTKNAEDNTTWRMAFVLPDTYTLQTAPKPTNDAVTLSERPSGTYAVITFNGSLNDDSIGTNKKQLAAWLQGQGFTVIGEYQAAGYNPPWTLPAFRKNEVMVKIEQ